MTALFIFPFILPFIFQGTAMIVDEMFFHRHRFLPRWERLGHPLDTITVLACFSVTVFIPFKPGALAWYGGLALFSCLFVTKDEFVHKVYCDAKEHWLHALLFIFHPLVFLSAGIIWFLNSPGAADHLGADVVQQLKPSLLKSILHGQAGLILLWLVYQLTMVVIGEVGARRSSSRETAR